MTSKQTDARKETELILGLVSAHVVVVAVVLATKDKMSCRIGEVKILAYTANNRN